MQSNFQHRRRQTVAKTWIDLNSDMGEGLGIWSIAGGVDEAIMPLISSANIATGFHAGDPNIMARTVALARRHDVGVGAHPGYADLAGFGRRRIEATASELVNDVVYQLGALREFARLNSVPLTHLKLHGALYMHAAADETFAEELVSALQHLDPTLPIFCMDRSKIFESASKLGQPANFLRIAITTTRDALYLPATLLLRTPSRWPTKWYAPASKAWSELSPEMPSASNSKPYACIATRLARSRCYRPFATLCVATR
jgi:hypothetical protein